MGKKSDNYFSFVTRRRGFDSVEENPSNLTDEAVIEALALVNQIASNLADLRRRADAGDVRAMYDANLQIEMLRTAREKLAGIGGRVRFDSKSNLYALV